MIEKLYNFFLDSSGVSTDTRRLNKDSIYFALKGENFDGNSYALDAIKNGAKLSVVDDMSLEGKHKSLVYVEAVSYTHLTLPTILRV